MNNLNNSLLSVYNVKDNNLNYIIDKSQYILYNIKEIYTCWQPIMNDIIDIPSYNHASTSINEGLNNNYWSIQSFFHYLYEIISYYTYFPSIMSSLALDIISIGAIICSILVVTCSNPVLAVLFLICLFINIAIYLILIGITFIGLTYIVVYIGAVTILFLFVIMLLNINDDKDYIMASPLYNIKKKNSGFVNIYENFYKRNLSNNLPIGILLGIILLFVILNITNYVLHDNSTFIVYDDSFHIDNKFIDFSSINKKDSSLYNDFICYSQEYQNIGNHYSFSIPMNINNSSSYQNTYNHYNKAIFNMWDGNMYTYTGVTSIGHILYSSHNIWFILVSLLLLLAIIGAICLTISEKTNNKINNNNL